MREECRVSNDHWNYANTHCARVRVEMAQGKTTGTYIHFDPAQDGSDGQTLTIRGPLLKVYRAHALLMRRYHETQAEASGRHLQTSASTASPYRRLPCSSGLPTVKFPCPEEAPHNGTSTNGDSDQKVQARHESCCLVFSHSLLGSSA